MRCRPPRPPAPPVVPPSFDAVPEARRSQLYSEYVAILVEAGVMAPGASAAAAAVDVGAAGIALAPAAGGSVDEGQGLAAGTQDEMELEWLRQEQARLKEEYAK